MKPAETLRKYGVLDSSPSTKLILLALAETDGATRDEIADAVGVSYSTVYNTIEELKSHDLITTEPTVDLGLGKAPDKIRLVDPDADSDDRPVWERATP